MGNLRIAVCDDESIDLAKTVDLLKSYNSEQQFQVASFMNAGELLSSAKNYSFDIVLMDIEMEPLNGFDAAKYLIAMDSPPVVIFTTKSNAYTLKGYGIAIRYLQKPLVAQDLYEALDVAIAEASAHRLTIQVENTIHAIPLRDIHYIETFGHYAVIHTGKESFRLRSTLKEIMAKLPRGYFVPTHKSYIVNLEHIRNATATEIHLDNGAAIPIGRTKAQEFSQALYRFLGR